MEKLNLRTKAGKAKIVGTIIGIGGAMILTFIKGVEIKMGSFHLNLLHHQNDVGSHSHATTISTGNTILGSLYAMVSAISYALWLIIQVFCFFYQCQLMNNILNFNINYKFWLIYLTL